MNLFRRNTRLIAVFLTVFGYFLIFNSRLKTTPPVGSRSCQIDGRNNVSTEILPDGFLYDRWIKRQINTITLRDGEMRLISAFVYEDYVAVVISMFGKSNISRPVTCHYYDCNRNYIGSFESRIHPISAIRCLRKRGADYISIGLASESEGTREPIPLIDRTWKDPLHEIGVCIGQIYGQEPRWMNIVDTIEHHRLIGATYFYLSVFEADLNTTHVILDYTRLGLLDVTWIELEFRQITFQFHFIQQADCYYRSRMHSKWVINIDVDERFVMTQEEKSLRDFLRVLPSNIVGLSFQVARIQINDSGIITDRNTTFFAKYKVMSRPFWMHLKSMYQPQHSHIPYYHWSAGTNPGKLVLSMNSTVGYFRHYRFTSSNHLFGAWVSQYSPFKQVTMSREFNFKLRDQIGKRLKYVFDKEYIRCDSILKGYRPGEFKNHGYICV